MPHQAQQNAQGLVEFTSFGTTDLDRLRAVIESSFGRPLDAAYFDSAHEGVRVLIGGDYEAVAILREVEGALYLDKFAVSSEAKGHGLAGTLWRAISRCIEERGGTLLWRSREHNSINGWYAERADGMVRRDGWVVFWAGDVDLAGASDLVEVAMRQPQDLPVMSSPMKEQETACA